MFKKKNKKTNPSHNNIKPKYHSKDQKENKNLKVSQQKGSETTFDISTSPSSKSNLSFKKEYKLEKLSNDDSEFKKLKMKVMDLVNKKPIHLKSHPNNYKYQDDKIHTNIKFDEEDKKDFEKKSFNQRIKEILNFKTNKRDSKNHLINKLLNENDKKVANLENLISKLKEKNKEFEAENCLNRIKLKDNISRLEMSEDRVKILTDNNKELEEKFEELNTKFEDKEKEFNDFKIIKEIEIKNKVNKLNNENYEEMNKIQEENKMKEDLKSKIIDDMRNEIQKLEIEIVILNSDRKKLRKDNFDIDAKKIKVELELKREKQRNQLFWKEKEFEWHAYQEKKKLEIETIKTEAEIKLYKEKIRIKEKYNNERSWNGDSSNIQTVKDYTSS